MKKIILILIGLILFVSCIFGPLPNDGFSNKEYYYYSGGEKIYFVLSLMEVYIAFENDSLSFDTADSILSKYDFLNYNDTLYARYFYGFKAQISTMCNDNTYKKYLCDLNSDTNIATATPYFYSSKNDPNPCCILSNQIIAKNNEGNITESDFVKFAKTYNLELISTEDNSLFRIKDVTSGFEALDISNTLYQDDKTQYAHPNFIFNIHW